jgi:formate dehydrogenase subunit gamma
MSNWNEQEAEKIVLSMKDVRGSLLPILCVIQSKFGYIKPTIKPFIAKTLNITEADLQGVISFYHDFRENHPGKHTIKICASESCQAQGSDDLIEETVRLLKTNIGEKSSNDLFTLETVYCLGNCGLGPSVLYDGNVIGRVTAKKIKDLLSQG